jgi:ADP-heptose:LPS heptosyltransferase
VEHIVTPSFRVAISAMSGASLYIGPDGGLHHVAAALGIPAVVLWGGVASPKNLGYDFHTNIWHGDEPCGTVNGICGHCKEAMAKITVEEVLEAVNARGR